MLFFGTTKIRIQSAAKEPHLRSFSNLAAEAHGSQPPASTSTLGNVVAEAWQHPAASLYRSPLGAAKDYESQEAPRPSGNYGRTVDGRTNILADGSL
ncbi:Hypothetical predicted protein [Podarcis lilfordi]|uniref:Uncharacterized protein n=1 Tax=Podarcis lilfordi TaxID=74358 RepID=A0AA35P6H8_9SAUR|nr:Hypothetical predicted protein [Podarcis lilfordi]